MLSQNGPKLYYARSTMPKSWSAGQNEMRAQPCPVHRETERFAALANGASPPAPRLDDRFAGPGETQAPRRPAGIRLLGVINQGLLPSHLEFCGGCSALGGRPERQLRAAAVILQ